MEVSRILGGQRKSIQLQLLKAEKQLPSVPDVPGVHEEQEQKETPPRKMPSVLSALYTKVFAGLKTM
jgi:hypothetical protein